MSHVDFYYFDLFLAMTNSATKKTVYLCLWADYRYSIPLRNTLIEGDNPELSSVEPSANNSCIPLLYVSRCSRNYYFFMGFYFSPQKFFNLTGRVICPLPQQLQPKNTVYLMAVRWRNFTQTECFHLQVGLPINYSIGISITGVVIAN